MTRSRFSQFASWLQEPIDGASLGAFRLLFGLAMAFSLIRFMASGWIETIFVEPSFFFKYSGFEWVQVWDPAGLYLHFILTTVAALMVAFGIFYRFSIVLFGLGFLYIQLMDQSTYLNHYYLVVLLTLLLCFAPADRFLSFSKAKSAAIPRWVLYLFRFQVTVVYFYAALAKVSEDWLLYAQPLNIWMSARTEIPIIGGWLDQLWVAYGLSWAGFLYDLTIPLWLWWSRTRKFAFFLVLAFHLLTQVFFDIGMFPTIMIVSSTLFFAPSWPRDLAGYRRIKFACRPFARLWLAARHVVPCQVQAGYRRIKFACRPFARLWLAARHVVPCQVQAGYRRIKFACRPFARLWLAARHVVPCQVQAGYRRIKFACRPFARLWLAARHVVPCQVQAGYRRIKFACRPFARLWLAARHVVPCQVQAGYRRIKFAPEVLVDRRWNKRAPITGLISVVVVVYCLFQVSFPARHFFYPGDVLWNELGMRYAWKVMVREKNGAVTYHVRNPDTGRTWQVSPHRYLVWRQVSEMSSQPDMILQLGQHVAEDFKRRGLGSVEVRAEALVSLNGRRSISMVDPTIDLRRVGKDVPLRQWILPGPKEPPRAIAPVAMIPR